MENTINNLFFTGLILFGAGILIIFYCLAYKSVKKNECFDKFMQSVKIHSFYNEKFKESLKNKDMNGMEKYIRLMKKETKYMYLNKCYND